MDKEKKSRGITRKAFNKLFKAIASNVKTEHPDVADIRGRITLLETKNNELIQLDKRIFEFMLEDPKCDEAILEKETEETDEYQLRYVKLQLEVSEFLSPTEDISERGDALHMPNTGGSRRKFKLPEIEFIKYGGEIKEWLHFWSQFSKIDGDEELAEEDKFQYLIQATKEGSRARELVTSFPPTGQNYKKAIEGLKTRFGRDDLQVEVYVRELLSLLLRKVLTKNETITLCALYDKLETQLRALESLGVTSEKNAAMLFPLVESCMPEELLRTWKRMSAVSTLDGSSEAGRAEVVTTSNRLNKLMSFLRNEVENEERITLAASGFDVSNEQKLRSKKILINRGHEVPTATSLISIKEGGKQSNNCVFCAKNHKSADCFKARGMSLEEKNKVIHDKRCCFYCLRKNHLAKYCKTYIKCPVCEGRHVVIMCPKLNTRLSMNEPRKEEISEVQVLMGCSSTPMVFLQTLMVNVKYKKGLKKARVLIDSGSQKSYILEEFADSMELRCVGTEQLKHTLFGGVQTKRQEHRKFNIQLKSLDKKYSCNFDVLSQPTIVQGVEALKNEERISELKREKIILTDVGEMGDKIHILIGADIAGKLYTGKRYPLKCGLIAMETLLGWTVMGKIGTNEKRSCEALNVMSMLVHDKKIHELWNLETIGIKDPIEIKSKHEREQEAKEFFINTIKRNDNGRYEIKLPWLESKQELPSNYEIAEKRLFSLVKKLKVDNMYEDYDKVLKEWMDEGIIEEVTNEDYKTGHFIPHRPVIKENSTTKLRPVFDASAKGMNTPSLNDCLEPGPNMIELINTVLLRFRINQVGVTSDIRRAFLQISVNKEDRDYLKFLWCDEENRVKVYRHARVVFGVSSSPFLLAAVLDYHLNDTLNKLMGPNDMSVSKDTVKRLITSFYVDNCVTSVGNEEELINFVRESKIVMSSAQFDLRGWEYTADNNSTDDETSIVLGLKWNKQLDLIELNLDFLNTIDITRVTKRLVLSVAHKVFDTIGVSCPVMLFPKLLLQEMWNNQVQWDKEVDENTRIKFIKWFNELDKLSYVKFPRWLSIVGNEKSKYSIHTFCDASKIAYAAAVFVRVETNNGIKVHLVQGKARVAPLKKLTIPRLELMAATVGARITSEIVKILKEVPPISICYWTDSTTVLTWIQRNEKWDVFVRNRVKEIHLLTKPEDWHHVPGECNPADLPSRGCSVQQLLDQRWWEGPNWLMTNPNEWPKTDTKIDEPETMSMLAEPKIEDNSWVYQYFTSFNSIRRLLAWIMRFANNCNKKGTRRTGELSVEEINDAEKRLMKMIQKEWFEDSKHLKNIASLKTVYDADGIMRVCTKIVLRDEDEKFRYPIVLPDQLPLVKLIIKERHEALNHAGVQLLLNNLRESFWIIKGRRAIRSVIKKCVKCNRFTAKRVETTPGILPLDRIRDAKVFEIVGVDYAGPLHIKGGKKVWICLFTCGVYRAVHMEVVSLLSTTAFCQALRRFIARRGRPTKVYSDNGTNFVGTENLMKSLNWEEIEKFAVVQKIKWNFNPPTAPWWGGWWERIIRIVKDLLKRVLGRACVSYEELLTIICDCESIINNRPITYMMDGDPTVAPLTPNMFLQEVAESGVADLDQIDEESLNKRIRYLQKLRCDLRKRFRKEYLGSLIQKSNKIRRAGSGLKIGEIVLIGNDHQKRLDWPLARVKELITGKDGEVRLARLKTEKGELLRPVQRIYRLEVYGMEKDNENLLDDTSRRNLDESQEVLDENPNKIMKTRTRIIRKPKRYGD